MKQLLCVPVLYAISVTSSYGMDGVPIKTCCFAKAIARYVSDQVYERCISELDEADKKFSTWSKEEKDSFVEEVATCCVSAFDDLLHGTTKLGDKYVLLEAHLEDEDVNSMIKEVVSNGVNSNWRRALRGAFAAFCEIQFVCVERRAREREAATK